MWMAATTPLLAPKNNQACVPLGHIGQLTTKSSVRGFFCIERQSIAMIETDKNKKIGMKQK